MRQMIIARKSPWMALLPILLWSCIDYCSTYRGTWQMRQGQRMRKEMTTTETLSSEGQLIDSEERVSPFPYHVTLDPLGGVQLNWTTSPDDKIVTFHLHAQVDAGGTFAVGFSDRGSFRRADLLFVWTDEDGETKFGDTWTDDNGFVHEDERQDFQILSFNKITRSPEPDVIAMSFSRKSDSCDDADYVIDRGTTHVLFLIDDEGEAWKKKSIAGYDTNVPSLKGFNRVQLLKAHIDVTLPPDAATFEIRNPDVHVPGTDTAYWCSIHRLPDSVVRSKGHVIQTQPIITPENRAIIHHMEVFHCETDEEVSNYSGLCTGPDAPFRVLEKCRQVIGAWAMGASTFTYPPQTGLAIGGEGYSPFVRLEVHFNNPNELTGHIDSSGLQFHYTTTLRQFDTGIMELGLEYGPKNSIPPQQPGFELSGYCIADCTNVALPRKGIFIFGGQLHTHNHGIKIVTRHFRNGIELPEVARDDHYSTHFQEIRLYPEPKHVLPGDDLITTCLYDTENENNITLSGYSIQEEMCVNYVYYYPRTNLEVCKSSIDTMALDAYFRLQRKLSGRFRRDLTLKEQDRIQKKYKSIRFDPFETKLLNKIYKMAPLSMQCNQSNGDRFPGFWEGKKLPFILFPLGPEKRDC